MSEQEEKPVLLSASALADFLDISPRTVNNWFRAGDIKGTQKANGRWYTTIDEVKSFLVRLETEKGRRLSDTRERFDAFAVDYIRREREKEEAATLEAAS